MMFALCTAVTLRRPFRRAWSNANSAIRRVPSIESGLIEMPEPGGTRPPRASTQFASSIASAEPSSYSIPAYRSSVASRTMIRSTFS